MIQPGRAGRGFWARCGVATAAAVLAAAAAMVGTPSMGSSDGVIAAAPLPTLVSICRLSPSKCTTLRISLSGNGSGQVVTTTASGKADGFIDCKRVAGTTQGTCSHTYYLGTARSITINLRETPATGSEACDAAGCTTNSNAMSVVIGAGQTITLAFAFRLVVASLPPPPSPIPTPTHAPVPTPKPAATAPPAPTAAPSAPVGVTSPPATSPEASAAASPPGGSTPPTASGAPSGAPSTAPGAPASSGGSDPTPLLIAVLAAGVLIVGAVYAGLRRRRAT